MHKRLNCLDNAGGGREVSLIPRLVGWGARDRTWDHGIKTRCLTAWLRPNVQAAGTLRKITRPRNGVAARLSRKLKVG